MSQETTVETPKRKGAAGRAIVPSVSKTASESRRKYKLLCLLLLLLLELLQSPARFPLAAVLLPTAWIPLSTAGRNRRLRRRGEFLHPLYRRVHPFLGWQRLAHQVHLITGEFRDNLVVVMVM